MPRLAAFSDHRTDRESAITTLLGVVFCMYFATITLELPSLIVPVGWAILLAFSLFTSHAVILLKLGYLHVFLAVVYLLGSPINPGSSATHPYLRTIAVSFVFSTIALSILTQRKRRIGFLSFASRFQTLAQRTLIVAVFIWSVTSIRRVSIEGIRDVREITGQSYLTTADLLACTGLAFLCRTTISAKEYVMASLLIAASLSFIGSRAAMLLFVLFSALGFIRKFRAGSIVSYSILGSIVVSYVFINYVDLEANSFGRLSSLLDIFLGNQDRSLSARNQMMADFFDTLGDNPTCWLVPCFPDTGSYAHNLLSLIQYFGLLGLALLIWILVTYVRKTKHVINSNFVLLLGFLLVSMSFARSWVGITFPLFLAFTFYLSDVRSPRDHSKYALSSQNSLR